MMATSEILQILKKGDEMTSSEISKALNISIRIINASIKRLLKDITKPIQFRPLTQEEKIERYGRNIGLRIPIYWFNGQDAKRMAA